MNDPSETIYRGVTWEMQVTVRDSDGAAVDMTVSGRSLLLRCRIPGTTTVAFSRDSETSTDFTWTTEASGIGKWTFYSDDTDLAASTGSIDYEVDAYYVNTAASPTERRFLGTATWAVRDPDLGDFS